MDKLTLPADNGTSTHCIRTLPWYIYPYTIRHHNEHYLSMFLLRFPHPITYEKTCTIHHFKQVSTENHQKNHEDRFIWLKTSFMCFNIQFLKYTSNPMVRNKARKSFSGCANIISFFIFWQLKKCKKDERNHCYLTTSYSNNCENFLRLKRTYLVSLVT